MRCNFDLIEPQQTLEGKKDYNEVRICTTNLLIKTITTVVLLRNKSPAYGRI